MTDPDVRFFVQARMSSTRFPGKVLAPLNGRPLISHVLSRVAMAVPIEKIIVATSIHPSDDPLVAYLTKLGFTVFRGSLDEVVVRFQQCLDRFPCKWVARVSADSPLWDPLVYDLMSTYLGRDDIDLITNVFPRTFPKGNSLEIIKSTTLSSIDTTRLSGGLREHVCHLLYEKPDDYHIINVKLDSGDQSEIDMCVDTVEDFRRVEKLLINHENCNKGLLV